MDRRHRLHWHLHRRSGSARQGSVATAVVRPSDLRIIAPQSDSVSHRGTAQSNWKGRQGTPDVKTDKMTVISAPTDFESIESSVTNRSRRIVSWTKRETSKLSSTER